MSVSTVLSGVKIVNTIWVVLAIFVMYKVVKWYRRYITWVEIYDKLPGKREKHWLWGHVHEHPGPGQAGIDFQLNRCRLYGKLHRVWVMKIRCITLLHHPDSLKHLLKKSGKHPGPGADGLRFNIEHMSKYPSINVFWVSMLRPMVNLENADTLKHLLKCSAYVAPKPRGQGTSYEIGINWLGEGLLIANGDKWARNRRLITPAFHFDILQNYCVIQNQCTDVLLSKMESFCKEGKTFEAFNHFGLSSLDIILRCAFSYKTDCQVQGEKHPYVQAVLRLSHLWMERALNPVMFLDFIYFNLTWKGREFLRLCKFVHGIAEDIINARKKTIETEGLPEKSDAKRSLDFLDIILTAKDDEGNGLSDLDIRNEVDTFLFEGHDTTTSAISFIMYSLAKHPDIQERCRAEVDAILEGRDSDIIEWKDLSKFEYLTMCIKEGLRCHSPVFFMQRQVSEDIEIEGYHIPAWSHVAINIYNVHHNETVWGPDHMEYKPDRFLPENISKMDTFAFIPFSAGVRNCIGQNFAMNEMKIVVSRLLHRYKFEVDPDHVVKKRMGVVMRTENGILLKPTRR